MDYPPGTIPSKQSLKSVLKSCTRNYCGLLSGTGSGFFQKACWIPLDKQHQISLRHTLWEMSLSKVLIMGSQYDSEDILANMYSLRRSGKLRSFDSAQKRIGKQAIGNRIDNIIKLLNMNWTRLHKKDEIRKYLKRYVF